MTPIESRDAFRSYFGSLHLLYVIEDGLASVLYDTFDSICPRISKMALSDLVINKQQLRTHVVIIELSKASKASLAAVFKKISSIETLLFCDNSCDPEVVDAALSNKIIGVLNRSVTQKELAGKLKELLFSISIKQKERSRNDNYAKLVENGDICFCIKKDGKFVFANTKMLSLFNAKSAAELNAIAPPKNSILEALQNTAENEEDSFYFKTYNDEIYLISVKSGRGEQLISCVKTEEMKCQNSGSLEHTDFIELLKNTLVHRDGGDEPTFAVAIKLDNASKILNDFGSEFFYTYFKKFGSFCGFFFEKEPFIFWQFDYMVILPEEKDENIIKAAAEELFAQINHIGFDNDVTPFVDIYVLSLSRLPIGEAISLIEKVYTKSYTPSQGAKISLFLSTGRVSAASGQMAMYHLQSIADKDYKIKLLNIYKGLSVVSAGKIIKIVDGDIYVQTEKIQKYLMHTEKSVVVQSEYTPKEIFAEVAYVDPVEPYAILRSPIFLEFSANNRKSVRVQCDTRIPITVSSSRFTFTGEIFDISMQAVAVKYKNRISGDITGVNVKLTFALPSKEVENSSVKVVLYGQITAVKIIDEQMRIIISIGMEPQSEEAVLNYIYTRQKELIAEIKKLGGMIFK